MARRLEGQKFITCYNNGVSAIANELVLDHSWRCSRIVRRLTEGKLNIAILDNMLTGALRNSRGPIFTFASWERVADSPWFAGDAALYEALLGHIEHEGGVISQSPFFYVPFSNGLELGLHDIAAQVSELAWVTSDWQFSQTFGITVGELRREAAKR